MSDKEQPSDEFVQKNIDKIKEYSNLFNAMAVEHNDKDNDN